MDYKGYEIARAYSATMYSIKLPGKGGSVPEVLDGLYTSTVTAKNAIDAYLGTKDKAGKKDDTIGS